jgi:ABC-type amino acid transport substrate-binding protein
VIKSEKLRCGYIVYPPVCIKDPSTKKLSGIGIEALEAVAKKLGVTIEYVEEVGLQTMIEGLKTGRYDLLATPIWTNANRAKIIDFSKPLLFNPIFVYARPGDKRFAGNFERINSKDITIATVDGGTAQAIAESDFPQARQLSLPELSDVAQDLLNVSTHKADLTFAEPALVERYLRTNKSSVEKVDPSRPIRMFPNCWAFNRGEFEFKAMLDTVLDELINSGGLDKIISKYEAAPHIYYRVALPYRVPLVTSATKPQ